MNPWKLAGPSILWGVATAGVLVLLVFIVLSGKPASQETQGTAQTVEVEQVVELSADRVSGDLLKPNGAEVVGRSVRFRGKVAKRDGARAWVYGSRKFDGFIVANLEHSKKLDRVLRLEYGDRVELVGVISGVGWDSSKWRTDVVAEFAGD